MLWCNFSPSSPILNQALWSKIAIVAVSEAKQNTYCVKSHHVALILEGPICINKEDDGTVSVGFKIEQAACLTRQYFQTILREESLLSSDIPIPLSVPTCSQ